MEPAQSAGGGIEEHVARGEMRRARARVGLEALGLAPHGVELALDRARLVEPESRAGREVLEEGGERDAQERGQPIDPVEVDPLPDQIAESAAVQLRGGGCRVEGTEAPIQILGV